VYHELLGKIQDVETIVIGHSIHDLRRLRRRYGPGRWRKMKGSASVQLADVKAL